MLDFNPDGKKLILAIDGGGMRGALTAALLAELEQMTGQTCPQMFDLVAGTSTGAVIAAALALGFSAQEILDIVYKDHLPRAFGRQDVGFWLRYLLGGLRHLYPLEPFLELLGPYAAGKRVGDLSRPILLMTTKDVRTGNTYYIVSAGPGAPAFADWPLCGAVAASAAAPIYLPPVARNLIDGSVGVTGNPCLVAATEAMQYIGAAEGFSDGNVILISLGTGAPPNTYPEGTAARFWLKDWLNYLYLEGQDDASLQQVHTTRAIYGGRLDFRRYNPLLTRESVHDSLGVPLEGRPDPARLGVLACQPQEIALMEDIGRAYARCIDWTRPNTMPWDTPGGQPLPGILPVDWSGAPFAARCGTAV